MRRLIIIATLSVSLSFLSYSQTVAEMENMIHLLGGESPETMDPEEVERLLSYQEHPLGINSSSPQQLAACGFLSRYQIMSLTDYKKRHGPVMSLYELAALDGFGEDFVGIISPFISLTGTDAPPDDTRLAGNVSLRTSLRFVNEDKWNHTYSYGLRGMVGYGDRFCATMGLSCPYFSRLKAPEAYTASVSYQFRSLPARLLAGDFNARFGQGLALWNGMSMGGIGTPESFMRNPTGISVVKSYTGSTAFTGVAADMSFGRFRLSAMMALPGLKSARYKLMPAFNLAWYGSFMQLGLTHYSEADIGISGRKMLVTGMKTAADAAMCINGTDIFSEIAYDWCNHALAGIFGAIAPVAGSMKMSVMVRCYPSAYDAQWSGAARSRTVCSNELGVSLGFSCRSDDMVRISGRKGFDADVKRYSGMVSADASYFPAPLIQDRRCMQFKLQTEWTFMLSESFRFKARATERVRTWGQPFRTDIRLDLTWFSARFTCSVRANILDCRGTGGLVYAEGGYQNGRFSTWFRQGFFLIDEWDDRIYVYERDVPGTFNIPAFYGRGMWSTLTGTWEISRYLKLCFRASLTEYPFMEKKKPGKAELRLQCVIRL